MRRIGLVGSAAVAVIALLAGCSSSDSGADGKVKGSTAGLAEKAPESPAAPADVRIVSAKFMDHETWGDNAYVVRWELTNTGSRQGNFYAGLDFLDKDGDVLGSTGITADKVGSGKTAKGEASPLDVEIDKGDLADIKDVKVSEVEQTDY